MGLTLILSAYKWHSFAYNNLTSHAHQHGGNLIFAQFVTGLTGFVLPSFVMTYF